MILGRFQEPWTQLPDLKNADTHLMPSKQFSAYGILNSSHTCVLLSEKKRRRFLKPLLSMGG